MILDKPLVFAGQWTTGLRPGPDQLIFAQVYDIRTTPSDPETLRQYIMDAWAQDSWIDRGGDFEVTYSQILGKTLPFARHHSHIHLQIQPFILPPDLGNGTSRPVFRLP